MKKYLILSIFNLMISVLYVGCKKNEKQHSSPIIENYLDVVSIIGKSDGEIDPKRKGFINLYDGKTYDQTEAVAVSSKIDFAYNYHGEGCNTCRFFENVKVMSTRTHYVQSFSTVTNSLILNAEGRYGITANDFGNIQSGDDIENLFSKHSIDGSNLLSSSVDITNREKDVAIGKVFAFIDKNGKKGFFLIGDYVANEPSGSMATLKLNVKVQQ